MGTSFSNTDLYTTMRAFVVASLLAAAKAEAYLPLGYNSYALNGAFGLGYNGYALGGALPYGAAPLAAAPIAAAPAAVTAVLKTAAPAIPSVTSSQYRAGDELGNTAFGYSNINSARQEQGNAAGVAGSYSFNDEAGLHTVNYVADGLGFRVLSRSRRSLAAAHTAYGYGLPALTYGANLALPAATYGAAAIPTVSAGYTALDSALSLPAAPLAASYPATTYAATTIAAAAPLAATYAAAPLAATYAAAPLAANYAAAPAIAAAPLAATYAAAPAQREAVLTTIKLNPGHATAYRVD